MFEWLRKRKEKKEALNSYKKKLFDQLETDELSDLLINELNELVKNYDLDKQEILKFHFEFFNIAYEKLMFDRKITSDENKKLEEIITKLKIDKLQTNYNSKDYDKFKVVGILEDGRFPVVLPPEQVVLKEGEIFRWAELVALVKFKKITKKIYYSGLNYKIRITKGLSYKIGSISPEIISSEVLSKESVGVLWLTDQNLVFQGDRKHFRINVNKIEHVEYSEGVLKIYKSGRETPYMVVLQDYDIWLKMISMTL